MVTRKTAPPPEGRGPLRPVIEFDPLPYDQQSDPLPPAAGSLEDLAAQAAAIDNPPAVDPDEGAPPPAPPPAVTNSQLLAGAIAGGRDVFCGFTGLQSPKQHLGPEQVQTLADAWGSVLDKHKINLSQLVGDYGPELAAVMVSVPIVIALRTAVRAELAAREGKTVEAAPGRTPSPPPGPVVGQVVEPGVIKQAWPK